MEAPSSRRASGSSDVVFGSDNLDEVGFEDLDGEAHMRSIALFNRSRSRGNRARVLKACCAIALRMLLWLIPPPNLLPGSFFLPKSVTRDFSDTQLRQFPQ